MRHAILAKKKHGDYRDDDRYLDKHHHILSSSAYHRAKQQSFLSGEDVLKSLQAEMEMDEETTSTALRVVST